MLLLACGAAALDCHADFWPEMHASPRRLEALILANGALVKLCFDADADGAVHRQHARAFLKAAGLVDVTVAGGLEDVLQRNDAVEAIVEVLFAARTRRPTRRCIESGSRGVCTPPRRRRRDGHRKWIPRRRSSGGDHLHSRRASDLMLLIRCSSRPGQH